jgi:hypothetical protein
MNLDEWKKRQQGEAFTLPSGLDVRLKGVDLLDLAALGKIPAPLAAAANRLVNNGMVRLDVEKFGEFVEVVDLVVAACLQEPAGLVAADLPIKDRLAIYNWACGGAAILQPFRGAPGKSTDAA